MDIKSQKVASIFRRNGVSILLYDLQSIISHNFWRTVLSHNLGIPLVLKSVQGYTELHFQHDVRISNRPRTFILV